MNFSKIDAELNDMLNQRSNNSFDASGISLPVIDNLAVPQMFPAASIRALGSSMRIYDTTEQ